MSEKISKPSKEKAAALLASLSFTAGACDKTDLSEKTRVKLEQPRPTEIDREEKELKKLSEEYTSASTIDLPSFAEKGQIILKSNLENGSATVSHGQLEELEDIDESSYDFVPFRQVDILQASESEEGKQKPSRNYRADRNLVLTVSEIEGETETFEFSGTGSHPAEAINDALQQASKEKQDEIPQFIKTEGGEETSVKTDSRIMTGVKERRAYLLDKIDNLEIEEGENRQLKVSFTGEVQDIPKTY